jgi:hypothetical protein
LINGRVSLFQANLIWPDGIPLKQIVVPALVEKIEAFACSMKLLTNPIILSEKGFLKRQKTDHILH